MKIEDLSINQAHQCEWINGSGVAPEIVSLNVKSLSRTLPHEYLLYSDKLERRNSGRLSDSYLRRYQHLEDGGWWCSGVDILTGKDSLWGCFKPNSPHVVTENKKQGHIKQKTIKYEHPPKVDTEVFALKIPYKIGLKIARSSGLVQDYVKRILQQYKLETEGWLALSSSTALTDQEDEVRHSAGDRSLELGGESLNSDNSNEVCQGKFKKLNDPQINEVCQGKFNKLNEIKILYLPEFLDSEDDGFWQWVIDNVKMPIILTEGAKKAGALLSAGYCAIAIPGIFNGYRQPKDEAGNNQGTPYLIPQLQTLAKEGREIYFAFDSDSKASTIANVNIAIEKTALLLEKEGCTCRVISWSNQYKGVDDFIVARGVEAFDKRYQQARTIALWRVTRLKQLTYPVTVEIDPLLRYLPKLEIPLTAKIIGLKARKGRGKTHQIAELVAEAIRQGRRTLIISHRRQLVANLCDRCGIDNVTEYRSSDSGGVFGYGLCVDSLHRHSQARFNPEEWEDALIIIDEVEQVFWHLLAANTDVSKRRVEIIKNFRILLRVVIGSEKGQVLVADADLSDISVEYIRSLVKNAPEPLIIYQPFDPSTITPEERWDIINYDHSNCKRLIVDLIEHIRRGGKPMICVSAQKRKSLYGTINLEATLKRYFPHLKILRIDSESITDPNHRAYGCIAHLNEVLPKYDIVLTSPSIETGVSIDLKGHFTSVWGIAGGVSADNAVCQALARVRENVPRYLWVSKIGCNHIGNSTTNVNELFSKQKRETIAHLALLMESEEYELHGIDTQFQLPSLWCWARMAVRLNLGMLTYRQSVLDSLQSEGHLIYNVDDLARSDGHQYLEPRLIENVEDIEDLEDEVNKCNLRLLQFALMAMLKGMSQGQVNRSDIADITSANLTLNDLGLGDTETPKPDNRSDIGNYFTANLTLNDLGLGDTKTQKPDSRSDIGNYFTANLTLNDFGLGDTETPKPDNRSNIEDQQTPLSLKSSPSPSSHLSFAFALLWVFLSPSPDVLDDLTPDEFVAQKQEEVKHIGSQLKEVCVDNCEVYRYSVSNAEKFDDREYEQVSRRLNPTQEERTRLHKTRLARQYYTDDVSPELVALDEKEGYIRIKLHYYLTVGRPYLKRRERHRLDKLLKQGHGALFSPDFNRQSLYAKIRLYEFLQFVPLLNKTCLHKDDPDLQRLAPVAKRFAADIKQILGVTINPKDSPVTVYRQLLRPLGITQLPKLGRFGERGDRHHVYNNPDWTERFAIFERWLAKEPPLPQEQPSPIDWALELLQRLEMPSVSFVDDESANLFLRGVQDKLSGVIQEVEQVCSGFCDRFWRAFTSAISPV